MLNSIIFTCLHNTIHSDRYIRKSNNIEDDDYHFLSNHIEDEEDDIVRGLNVGAEDYIDIYDCIVLGASIGIILSIFVFILT